MQRTGEGRESREQAPRQRCPGGRGNPGGKRRTRDLVVGHEDHGPADEFCAVPVLAPTEREPFMNPLRRRLTLRAERVCDERHEPTGFDMQCTVRAAYG